MDSSSISTVTVAAGEEDIDVCMGVVIVFWTMVVGSILRAFRPGVAGILSGRTSRHQHLSLWNSVYFYDIHSPMNLESGFPIIHYE